MLAQNEYQLVQLVQGEIKLHNDRSLKHCC